VLGPFHRGPRPPTRILQKAHCSTTTIPISPCCPQCSPGPSPAAGDKINGPSGRIPAFAISPLPPSPTPNPLPLLPNRGTSLLLPPKAVTKFRHDVVHAKADHVVRTARGVGGVLQARESVMEAEPPRVPRVCRPRHPARHPRRHPGVRQRAWQSEDGCCVAGARAPENGSCTRIERSVIPYFFFALRFDFTRVLPVITRTHGRLCTSHLHFGSHHFVYYSSI